MGGDGFDSPGLGTSGWPLRTR